MSSSSGSKTKKPENQSQVPYCGSKLFLDRIVTSGEGICASRVVLFNHCIERSLRRKGEPHKDCASALELIAKCQAVFPLKGQESPSDEEQWDLRLYKLVLEEDGLPDGTALTYSVRGLKVIEVYKKALGIFCYHCNSEVSALQFESHAGYGSRCKAYLNIYASNGVSLHELSVSMSKSQKLSDNDNHDLCNYHQEFGDLLCCDMCPRAFHQVADGRVSGVDPIEQITQRCIHIVETNEPGRCAICRIQTFSKEFGPKTVITSVKRNTMLAVFQRTAGWNLQNVAYIRYIGLLQKGIATSILVSALNAVWSLYQEGSCSRYHGIRKI